MKIKLKLNNGHQTLVIKYTQEEWQTISKRFEDLGLQVADTRLGLGMNLEFKYYRDVENMFGQELLKFLDRNMLGVHIINDINMPAITDYGEMNIAILRIIPNENLEVHVPLHKWVNLVEFRDLVRVLVKCYEFLFNILKEAEVEIKLPKE